MRTTKQILDQRHESWAIIEPEFGPTSILWKAGTSLGENKFI